MKIAVLPGDGIGPEVIEPALELLSEHEITTIGAGANRYLETGELLTPADLETITGADALLLGAVGDPRVEDGVLERGILLRLRRELDLYVNLRPVPELGVVFVRENTEGLYAGVGTRTDGAATETSINTATAIERCATYAFELAAARRGRVTLVHKTNVLVNAGGLWRDVVARVSRVFDYVELL
jgi:3-isopropylmalate dehydrogenase